MLAALWLRVLAGHWNQCRGTPDAWLLAVGAGAFAGGATFIQLARSPRGLGIAFFWATAVGIFVTVALFVPPFLWAGKCLQ